LHIRKGEVELAPGRRITTTTYNGLFCGPALRTTVGQQMRVDVHNETDTTEQIHWQGQTLADATAALIPAHSARRMEFTPQRAGVYLYHSEVVAAADLGAGLYSGQAGALLVEPRTDPGRYDREWLVVLKGCEPFMRRTARGCEVGYCAPTLNGYLPGHGRNPLRANTGERLALHVLNAGATEFYNLELPGHVFEVTALDGNPLTIPVSVAALRVSPGERVSAYVVLNQATGWRLGEMPDATPHSIAGTLRQPEVDATFAMVLTRHAAARSGFNRWAVNGASFSSAAPQTLFRVRSGGHYRLQIHNTSDEVIPLHLQRHRLQVAGVLKDVVVVGPQQRLEVDFRADERGPALFHSTRQLQSDFGLRGRLDYT
jgi:FtsP/CotA-like multicopper oxidase with cupredoxin domain